MFSRHVARDVWIRTSRVIFCEMDFWIMMQVRGGRNRDTVDRHNTMTVLEQD